jgi:hypothetical protein
MWRREWLASDTKDASHNAKTSKIYEQMDELRDVSKHQAQEITDLKAEIRDLKVDIKDLKEENAETRNQLDYVLRSIVLSHCFIFICCIYF